MANITDWEYERFSTNEAFEAWFNEEIYSLEDAEDDKLLWLMTMIIWCKKNNHEMREDGVYNMNIKCEEPNHLDKS